MKELFFTKVKRYLAFRKYSYLASGKKIKKIKSHSTGSDKYIFIIFFISIYLLFKESSSPLPEFLFFLKPIFTKSQFSEILYSLSSGYLVGFFVWYLDIYLPKKNKVIFAHSTFFADYFSICMFVENIVVALENEFEHENYFFGDSSRLSGLHFAEKIFPSLSKGIDYSDDFEYQSKDIFKDEFTSKFDSIILSIDKILTYSNTLDMEMVNSLIHIKHYLSIVDKLLARESLSKKQWHSIINYTGEILFRTLVLFKHTNKYMRISQSTYIHKLYNLRNDL